jgi:uncharacterized cupredoxin-like copper-binding protein
VAFGVFARKEGAMPRKKSLLVILVGGGLAALALTVAACGGDSNKENATQQGSASSTSSTVNVSLSEWSIVPDKASVLAGRVTFNARNDSKGDHEHEMVVVRTDLDPSALPVAEGEVDENQIQVIGEIEGIAPGATGSVTLDLQPGKYVLICNLVEQGADGNVDRHYQFGMRTAFEVTA